MALVSPDGWTEYVCLNCDRPVSPARQRDYPDAWRHHQRRGWVPRGRDRRAWRLGFIERSRT